ncbi:MAG TPA: hypothetical protein VGK74_08890 [Symbiobacteriaceae bacterium]
MQEAWGGVISHIKTSTNVETGEVSIFKTTEGEKGAVLVRLYGALNSAEFSLFRPLRKLNLKEETATQADQKAAAGDQHQAVAKPDGQAWRRRTLHHRKTETLRRHDGLRSVFCRCQALVAATALR